MKKIAVLRCLRTSNNCTGSGCLKAFNNKTNAFAVYEAEETELAAFLNCSGCGDVQMQRGRSAQKAGPPCYYRR